MISIVKKGNVPAPAKRIEELKKRARPFRKFETAKALAFDVASVASHHVSHVELGQFIIRKVGCFVALAKQIGLDLQRILAAADTDSNENICALTVVETVIEFRDDPPSERRAKLAE